MAYGMSEWQLKMAPTSFSVRQHPQRTPEGTPAVLTSPAASLDDHFEQPVGIGGWKMGYSKSREPKISCYPQVRPL